MTTQLSIARLTRLTSRAFFQRLTIILIGAALLYHVGNARIALWDRDEPRYAMASRWMASSGDWVVPRIGWGDDPATPRTAKPPFIYWCQAAAMNLLGPTPYAARLPSALATLATLALLALFAQKMIGPRRALWSVFILATSAIVIAAAKMCITDVVLLFWVTLSQMMLYLLTRRRRDWWIIVLFSISIGFAGLTKGPVVLGVSATTLLALWLIRARTRGRIRFLKYIPPWKTDLRIVAAIVIIAVITLPWMILVERRQPGFISHALHHDVMKRMSTGLEGHKGPPGFYLVTLFATFFPWSLFLPMALVSAWRHRRTPIIQFSLAAIIGPWIMMELVQTKLVHYVLPIFPWLAIITADALIRHFRNSTKPKPHAFPINLALTFTAICFLLFAFVLPNVSYLRLSPRVASLLPPNQQVRMIGYKEQSLAFYYPGRIDEDIDQLLDKSKVQDWPPYIVLTKELYVPLPDDKKSHLRIMGTVRGINYAKSLKVIEVLVAQKQ